MTILLTKALPQSSLDLINSYGWEFDIINALDIALVDVNNLPDVKTEAWIISSRNSLAVVQKFILQVPPIIYCIGHWMSRELKKIFPPSQIFPYKKMKDLVEHLQKQNHKQLLYFCADNHRGELEEGLKGTPSIITKLTTHESRMTYPKLNKNYDAVFVFSPRSAESLLKNNSFSDKTIFVCIGPTTVSYLNEQSIVNTFEASYPESEILMKEFRTHITNIPAH